MVRLRPASMADSDALFAWRNDPLTRANSKTTTPLDPRQHVSWLERVLADPTVSLYVAEERGRRLGVVRIDSDGAVAITVAPEHRGKGLATEMLLALPTDRDLRADIRTDNLPSRRAFEKAGFVWAGEKDAFVHYRRSRQT